MGDIPYVMPHLVHTAVGKLSQQYGDHGNTHVHTRAHTVLNYVLYHLSLSFSVASDSAGDEEDSDDDCINSDDHPSSDDVDSFPLSPSSEHLV